MPEEKLSTETDHVALIAYYEEREVRTCCGDFYYDYSISFDDLFRFVEHIKEMEKKFNGRN